MATYRHKVKGTIATEKGGNYEIKITNSPSSWYTCVLPKWIVENSSDRELVEERDWIDDAISVMEKDILDLSDRGREKIREAIEKHAPKQKEINYLELGERYKKTAGGGTVCFADICDLLRDKGFLSPSD